MAGKAVQAIAPTRKGAIYSCLVKNLRFFDAAKANRLLVDDLLETSAAIAAKLYGKKTAP